MKKKRQNGDNCSDGNAPAGVETTEPEVGGREESPTKFTKWRIPFWLLSYIVVALFFFVSVLGNPFHLVAGHFIRDIWPHLWLMDWPGDFIHHWFSGMRSGTSFFPEGEELFVTFGPLLDELLWYPITRVFGTVAGVNLFLIFSLVAGAILCRRFALDLGMERESAWYTGLVFGFSPFWLAEIVEGRVEGAASFWFPLSALMIERAVTGKGFRYIPAAAAAIVGLTLADLNYGLVFAVAFAAFSVFYGSYSIIGFVIEKNDRKTGLRESRERTGPTGHRDRFRGVIAISAIAIISAGILLPWALFFQGRTESDPALDAKGIVAVPSFHSAFDHTEAGSVDPSRFFRLNTIPIHGGNMGNVFIIGLSVVVIVFMGIALGERRSLVWSVSAFGAFILSWGPYILVRGDSFYLPFAFLQRLPFFWRFHMPYRFGAVMIGCMAMGAGFGIDGLAEKLTTWKTEHNNEIGTRKSGNRIKISMPAGIVAKSAGVLFLLETVILSPVPVPLPVTRVGKPAVYMELSRCGEPGALLELPFLTTIPVNGRYLAFRKIHGKALVNGVVSNYTPGRRFREFFEKHELLRSLLAAQSGVDVREGDFRRDAESLLAEGLRYYVVHDSLMTPQESRRVRLLLEEAAGPAVWSSGGAALFDAGREKGETRAGIGYRFFVEQETAIRDVVSDNREVPLVAGIGVFPWKKTRFDKIVLERMTAERINRVLSGGIARVVKETR